MNILDKEIIADLKDDILELYCKNHTIPEITEELERRNYDIALCCTHKQLYNRVYNYVKRHIENEKEVAKYEQLKVKGFEDGKDNKKPVVVLNTDPKCIENDWDGEKIIKFGLMGDTQLGSKYAQITYLNDFYKICKKEGVDTVYHTGDITDGIRMRPGHEFELYAVSTDDLIQHVVDVYPKIPGITTKFITGNHDASIYKHVGFDIGKAIANARDDMEYLGRDCAIVNLTPNCTLELRHPWDGTAYAQSYKIQKMVEAMESDSKPNILAVGHYHKCEYLFYRNIHCFQTGCFQGQTPFTRGKGISISLGGWIVTVKVDSEGTIKNITSTYYPFYSSIKDDYKKYI